MRTSTAPVLKSESQIAIMRQNALLLWDLFRELKPFMQPGSTGIRIQEFCLGYFKRTGLKSLLKGYRDFPADICVSRNEVAVHGLPDLHPFRGGDVITVDVAVTRLGYCADAAWTYLVAPHNDAGVHLVRGAWLACTRGVLGGIKTRRLSGIVNEVQGVAVSYGLDVLPRFCGHGIGRHLHEEPRFSFIVGSGGSTKLEDGMVLNIEPVICAGLEAGAEVVLGEDEWSWTGPEGLRTAQYELSLAFIPGADPIVLTLPDIRMLSAVMPPFY